jgi:hypothetical protein
VVSVTCHIHRDLNCLLQCNGILLKITLIRFIADMRINYILASKLLSLLLRVHEQNSCIFLDNSQTLILP